MPVTIDAIFDQYFGVTTLTDAVNRIDPVQTRLQELGLFDVQGIATTHVVFDVQDGQVRLIPVSERGGPPPVAERRTRIGKTFTAVHVSQQDSIRADELQNVRAFGSSGPASVETIRNQRLADMTENLDLTLEWHRMGAIKGQIVDADGTTVLLDLYNEMGVTQEVVAFNLSVDTTKVRQLCQQVSRKIEKRLGSRTVREKRVLCSPEFFDALVDHPNVTKAYEATASAAEMVGGDVRRGFRFGGLVFEDFPVEVDGKRMIAAGEAYVVPVGVRGLFRTYFAPADYMEAANTLGLPRYAKAERMPMDKGLLLEVQSNWINICTRPEVVIKLTA